MGNRWLGTHVRLGQFGSRWSKSNLGQSCCNAFVSQIISIKHLLFHRLEFIMGECDICATLLDLCVASHPLLQGLNLETLPKVKLATPPYSGKLLITCCDETFGRSFQVISRGSRIYNLYGCNTWWKLYGNHRRQFKYTNNANVVSLLWLDF